VAKLNVTSSSEHLVIWLLFCEFGMGPNAHLAGNLLLLLLFLLVIIHGV
jgi:hypothetical protein